MIYDNCVVAYFSGPPCKSIDTDREIQKLTQNILLQRTIKLYESTLNIFSKLVVYVCTVSLSVIKLPSKTMPQFTQGNGKNIACVKIPLSTVIAEQFSKKTTTHMHHKTSNN